MSDHTPAGEERRQKRDRREENLSRLDQLNHNLDRNFRWLVVVCVMLLAGGAFEYVRFSGITGSQATRLRNDEHSTCVIQARGLPASHELSSIMQDIDVLLFSASGKPSEPLTASEVAAITGLRDTLPAYVRTIAAQPATRTC